MATSTAIKTAFPPLDVHGRTPEQQEADRLFREDYQRVRDGGKGKLNPVDPKLFGHAAEGAFLTFKRVRGDTSVEEKVSLPSGLYNLKHVEALATKMGMAKAKGEDISKAIAVEGRVRYGVAVSPETEASMGRKTVVRVAPDVSGYVNIPGIELPVVGTAIIFREDGGYQFGSITSREEYLRWLPLIQGAWSNHNGWCVDLPSTRVLDLVDQTSTMLDNLNNQLKNLHGVTIYMIAPRWLRYFSDGSMDTQRSGEYGLRLGEGAGGGMRPLLYDAPAWVVGLRFGKIMIPGRVFVTPEGRFICSDWCQREVDKGGGIDLHTGQYTRHTLMSWCAGPGISRFGGNDPEIAARHGTVVRARLSVPTVSAKVAGARRALLQQIVLLKNKPTLRHGQVQDSDATQVKSLRYYELDPSDLDDDSQFNHYNLLVGVSARFGKYMHEVRVPVSADGFIVPGAAEFHRWPFTGWLGLGYSGETYVVDNTETAQNIVALMKEAF